MDLKCDIVMAEGFTSLPQRARLISEAWFERNGFCLACESDKVEPLTANTRASDFRCPNCEQRYELKSYSRRPARNLVDGAYASLLGRILDGSVPAFLLLERTPVWQVKSLTAIHSMFLTPEVVVARAPLSALARRAGWVGCNIRLDKIADDAKVAIVSDFHALSPINVRKAFQVFNRLKSIRVESRGWTTLTIGLIRVLGMREFTLGDLYSKESEIHSIYPKNRNIRAKIRQQLQVIRDLGYLEFLGDGTYRWLL